MIKEIWTIYLLQQEKGIIYARIFSLGRILSALILKRLFSIKINSYLKSLIFIYNLV